MERDGLKQQEHLAETHQVATIDQAAPCSNRTLGLIRSNVASSCNLFVAMIKWFCG
jgi:hypothetical protein